MECVEIKHRSVKVVKFISVVICYKTPTLILKNKFYSASTLT